MTRPEDTPTPPAPPERFTLAGPIKVQNVHRWQFDLIALEFSRGPRIGQYSGWTVVIRDCRNPDAESAVPLRTFNLNFRPMEY